MNEAFVTDRFGTSKHFDFYKDWYVQMYIGRLRETLLELDPWRPFLGSSPTNGAESEAEGWVAHDPTDPRYGDLHTYIYEADDLWQQDTYPVGRFVSEFGFQSPASLSAWRAAADPTTDWDTQSDVFKHRQHSGGNTDFVRKAIDKKFAPANFFPLDTLELVGCHALSRCYHLLLAYGMRLAWFNWVIES